MRIRGTPFEIWKESGKGTMRYRKSKKNILLSWRVCLSPVNKVIHIGALLAPIFGKTSIKPHFCVCRCNIYYTNNHRANNAKRYILLHPCYRNALCNAKNVTCNACNRSNMVSRIAVTVESKHTYSQRYYVTRKKANVTHLEALPMCVT